MKGIEFCSFYVYLFLCEFQVMGLDIVDLLCQVVYSLFLKGGLLYELYNIQYVGVCQKDFEIVEIEISEVDKNSLVKFYKGNMMVMVYFKRV